MEVGIAKAIVQQVHVGAQREAGSETGARRGNDNGRIRPRWNDDRVPQPDPTWTDIAQVVLVAAQLLVLVVAAIYAKRQVEAAKGQLAEATRLREEQARPFVVIDLEPESIFLQVSVTNIGTTLATDVQFRFDPPLDVTLKPPSVKDLKMFNEGIPTLAPGKVIRTLFDSFPARIEQDLPEVYKVSVTYGDETRRRSFSETIDLDMGIYRDAGEIKRHDVHDVNKTLGKVLKEIKHWSSPSHRGLLTLSPEQRRGENERIARELKERRSPPSGQGEPG